MAIAPAKLKNWTFFGLIRRHWYFSVSFIGASLLLKLVTYLLVRFKDEDFVKRFVELYSLEDNKGAEKVDIIRRHFYRDLFRNYGWSLFKSVFYLKFQVVPAKNRRVC